MALSMTGLARAWRDSAGWARAPDTSAIAATTDPMSVRMNHSFTASSIVGVAIRKRVERGPPTLAARAPVPGLPTDQEQPAANALRKHWKSAGLSTGGAVEWSQLASEATPKVYAVMKHWKSLTFRIGIAVELSQLA